MTDLLDDLLADLKAEGDQLWSAVVRPRRRRLGDAHPGRRAGRRHPGRPPALDRRGRGARRAPTRRRGTRSCWRRSPTRRATSTPGAHEVARLAPQALLARWGAAREALGHGAARATPRARRCRGSARRCRRRRWRPRGSWRPGRTRSTSTTRSASTPEPTDRIRHVAHLGVRTRNFAFSRARARRRRPRSSGSS